MFYKHDPSGYIQVLEGLRRKTLAYGAYSLLTEFRFEQGSRLPIHTHPQEQTGYLVSGRMLLTIGCTVYDMKPGDSWSIPGGVEHGAEVMEETLAIEVFSPVRPDYLPEQPD